MSEAVNIFVSDILYDTAYQEAVVALVHPTEGLMENNKGVLQKRADILRFQYGAIPRCNLPRTNPRHAGWKGMDEVASEDSDIDCLRDWPQKRWTVIEWLLPAFGRKFWQVHQDYVALRRATAPAHPYYFVNFTRNIGRQLTRRNLAQILHTSCKHAGIPAMAPHDLRHMFGATTADWGVPPEIRKRMMRHISSESTALYSKPYSATIRKLLTNTQKSLKIDSIKDSISPTENNERP